MPDVTLDAYEQDDVLAAELVHAVPIDASIDATEQDDVLASEIFHLGIASVAPSVGTDLGGMLVTITGVGFTAGVPTVDFDGIPATDVIVNSDTELTCVSPAGFTVSPSRGDANGGDSVIIRGRNFTAGSTVLFGSRAALNVAVLDSRTIACATPPPIAGGYTSVTVNGTTRTRAYHYGHFLGELSFWDSAFGTAIGDINVWLAKENGELVGSPLYAHSGNRGTSAWQKQELEFKVPEHPYRFVFHHLRPGNWTQTGNYAVDAITILDEYFNFGSGHQNFRTVSGINTEDPVEALENSVLVPTTSFAVLGRWNRWSGATPTGSTGPAGAYDSTHYMFTRTSSPNTGSTRVNFWLFSPVMPPI